jgi:hypothetical protein
MNCENRSAQIRKLDRSVIVGRIEMIARELAELRRMVESAFPPEAPSSLTSQLLGCLGSEPLDAYDYSDDWQRFGADDRLS